MSDYLKIHYEDEYDFAKKILNSKNSVLNKDICFETYFLTPSQIEIVKNILGKEVNYKFYGGEEYQRVKVYKNNEREDKGVTCFKIIYNKNFGSVEHRSILGSLLSLGIKREVIGDIYVGDEVYYYDTLNDTYIVKYGIVKTKTGDNRSALYTFEENEKVTISSDRILGVYKTSHANLGKVLGFLQSTVGFLIFVILPILVLFIYQIYKFFFFG